MLVGSGRKGLEPRKGEGGLGVLLQNTSPDSTLLNWGSGEEESGILKSVYPHNLRRSHLRGKEPAFQKKWGTLTCSSDSFVGRSSSKREVLKGNGRIDRLHHTDQGYISSKREKKKRERPRPPAAIASSIVTFRRALRRLQKKKRKSKPGSKMLGGGKGKLKRTRKKT